MGRYTKLRKIMLIIVVIPRANKNIMDKDVADTITGTIINIAKGLVIPPEKNSKMEIWKRSYNRIKNALKSDSLLAGV